MKEKHMPVIRCSLTKDGKLIPLAVEFEPGDTILFESNEPLNVRKHNSPALEVLRPLTLNDVSVHKETKALQIDIKGKVGNAPVAAILYNPPPPPPHITNIVIQAQSAAKGKKKVRAAGGAGA
jgi:hypothetical protein